MPKLGGIETEKVILPSSKPDDEAWVIVQKNLPARDVLDLKDEDTSTSNQAKVSFKVLAKYIQEWNFTDAEGNIAPVTEENVGQLSVGDVVAITQALDLNMDLPDIKKKQSESSSPASQVTPPSSTSS